MFHVTIKDTYDEVSKEAFKIMKSVLDGDHTPVLGLATGSSPVGLYQEMIKDHKENGTSYKDILTFNLDEYIGLPRDHRESYWTFMHQNLFNYIDIPDENVHVPLGCGEDPEADCRAYEDELSRHIVDVQVLGIGSDGHIAFNEPGCPFDSLTHQVPTKAATMGLASIMRARKIIMIATGENKADAIKGMMKGPMTVDCPASILQAHPEVYVFLDKAAASKL